MYTDNGDLTLEACANTCASFAGAHDELFGWSPVLGGHGGNGRDGFAKCRCCTASLPADGLKPHEEFNLYAMHGDCSETTASETVALLNSRFRDAVPSSEPLRMGVILHAADGFEESNHPWRACERTADCLHAGSNGGRPTGGREAASVIYQYLRDAPNWHGQAIPIYGGWDVVGFLINPVSAHFLCGYPGDGDSQDFGYSIAGNKNCDPPSGSATCKPGCQHPAGWCDPDAMWQGGCLCGRDMCNGQSPRPWHVRDFAQMAQVYSTYGGHSNWIQWKYNEYILNATHWNANLPSTIQAIFYICGNGNSEQRARKLRTNFMHAYDVESRRAPLVCFNWDDWETPFTLIDG